MKTWCFPKEASGEYLCRMEDVLKISTLARLIRTNHWSAWKQGLPPTGEGGRRQTAVAFKPQLIGQVADPEPLRSGQPRREDYEYVRNGTCNLFMFCQPLAGWRHVQVTERRTKCDWAHAIRHLVDVQFPEARRIRVVLDNLNTHTGASLYEAFTPTEARCLLDKLEFHDTPKHTSWLPRHQK